MEVPHCLAMDQMIISGGSRGGHMGHVPPPPCLMSLFYFINAT